MSNVIRSLMVKVGADLTDFDKGMKQTAKNFGSIGKTFTTAGKGLTAGVTVPIVGAVAGLTGLAVKGAETADEILTLSSKTGIAAKTLQEMQYASELVDVPLETMTGSMFKLGKSMDAARSGTGSQADAFKALGISVTNSDGSLRDSKEVWYEAIDALGSVKNETERNVLAQKIFGKSFADVNPLIAAGGDALKGYMDEAGKMGAVLSDADLEALGKLDDTIQKLKATFAATGAKLGAAFIPILQSLMPILENNIIPAVKQFADFVAKVSEKFSNLSPEMQGFVLKLIAIAAAAGPTLIVVGKLFDGFKKGIETFLALKNAFGIVGGAFKSLGALMMANPIILIIAAIAVAALLIITHWEPIKEFFVNLWGGITAVFSTAWEAIKGVVLGIWNGIVSVASTIWGGLTGFFGGLWDGISSAATTAWNGITSGLSTIWGGVKSTASTVWGGISSFFTGLWDTWKTNSSATWETIKSAASTIWGGIKSTASTVWGGISTFFGNLWSTWKTNSATTWSTIASGTSTAWSGIKTTISNLGGQIKTNLSTFGSNVVKNWNEIWPKFKNGITGAIGGIKTAASGIVTAVANVLKELPGKALQWGKDLINGLIKGIKSMLGALGTAAKSIASKITSFLHFSTPDEGPLAEYEKWMPDFMGGLASGIKNNKHLVQDAISGLSSDMSVGVSAKLNSNVLNGGSVDKGMTSNYNTNNSFTINATVRDDSDINKIADAVKKVLYADQQRSSRGRGILA